MAAKEKRGPQKTGGVTGGQAAPVRGQSRPGQTAGGSPANVPYSAWRFATTTQEPEKKPSRLRQKFAFLEAFRVTGTDASPRRLRLYSLGLSAAFTAVYLACFTSLYLPLRTLTARLPFDLSFGLGALAAAAAGSCLCCLSWFPLKQYRRLIASAYGTLGILSLALFGIVQFLLWGDEEAQQITLLFFGRYALFPLLVGGSLAATLCLWDWMREQEQKRKGNREQAVAKKPAHGQRGVPGTRRTGLSRQTQAAHETAASRQAQAAHETAASRQAQAAHETAASRQAQGIRQTAAPRQVQTTRQTAAFRQALGMRRTQTTGRPTHTHTPGRSPRTGRRG